jgi:hypothetical protein
MATDRRPRPWATIARLSTHATPAAQSRASDATVRVTACRTRTCHRIGDLTHLHNGTVLAASEQVGARSATLRRLLLNRRGGDRALASAWLLKATKRKPFLGVEGELGGAG